MFSPAGLAAENRNIALILGVTAALIVVSVVIFTKEMSKKRNSKK